MGIQPLGTSSGSILKLLLFLNHAASGGSHQLILCCFKYTALLKELLDGVSTVAFIYMSLLLMNRLNTIESGIFLSCVISLLSKDLFFQNL